MEPATVFIEVGSGRTSHPAVCTDDVRPLFVIEVELTMALQTEFASKSLMAFPADKRLQRWSVAVRRPNVLFQRGETTTFHVAKSADSEVRRVMRPFMGSAVPITAK